jgi:hypothetical protein
MVRRIQLVATPSTQQANKQANRVSPPIQTALFNFTSLLLVILLLVWYDLRRLRQPSLPSNHPEYPKPDPTERTAKANLVPPSPHSTCAYVHQLFPAILDRNKTGLVASIPSRPAPIPARPVPLAPPGEDGLEYRTWIPRHRHQDRATTTQAMRLNADMLNATASPASSGSARG